MFRIFTHEPLTQAEAITKLSQQTPIKMYTSQILAMAELDNTMPGQKFCVMA